MCVLVAKIPREATAPFSIFSTESASRLYEKLGRPTTMLMSRLPSFRGFPPVQLASCGVSRASMPSKLAKVNVSDPLPSVSMKMLSKMSFSRLASLREHLMMMFSCMSVLSPAFLSMSMKTLR